MPKLIVCFAALVILLSISANGQPLDPSKDLTQYNLDHWQDDQSPSSILQIIQTSDGYLWMATLKGLVRFDGVKLTTFDKFTNPELKVNGFKSIFQDSKKDLWMGSIGGGLFRKEGNVFKQFVIPFGPSSNNIERITEDSKHNLWVCTLRGLIRYSDSTFTLMDLQGKNASGDLPVYDVVEDKTGVIWVATAQGLMKLSNSQLQPLENAKGVSEIMDLYLATDDKLWIASYSNGIYTYTDSTFQKVKALDVFKHPMAIYQDTHGNIWIGSEMGVARFRNGLISRLEYGKGLSHNHVTTVLEDHEGSIWLGTYYGGINRLRDGTFTNYTSFHGLPHNTVHCIFQRADKSIWIGTETDVAYKAPEDERFSRIYPELKDARVRDIFEDSKRNLWIATYDGLYAIDSKNRLTFYNSANGISSSQTRLVFEDREGAIWLGTRQGLNRFRNGKWEAYSEREGLLNDFIMSITQRRNGELIIGTTGGLFVRRDDKFEALKVNNEAIGLTTFHTYEDEANNLWAATTNGLLLINARGIFRFTSDRLLAGNIYQIIEDHLGAFWMTSDLGIIRVMKKNLLDNASADSTQIHTRLFDKSSGLRTNETTPAGHGFLTTDQKIWFPTLEGVAVVDPANIIVNTTPPPISIEELRISGREFPIAETVSVPPNSRNIEIHYTGLSFMIPKKVKFKYRLNGYDKEWHDAGERRTAYYTAVPPGDYTFSIKASNNDGVWNTIDTALTLHVERAFWQTLPFYFFTVVTCALIVFGIIHLRTRNVKRLNVMLEDKILQRTQEVISQKEEIESQRDYIESKNHELEHARRLIERQYEKLREVNENLETKVEDRTKELRKAYEDLITVNKELDDFVYKSAHDIKGPLARLQGLCNLALMEADKIPSREYLVKLQQESLLANRVIEKLAHTYEVKHHKLNVVNVNIYEVVSETIRQLKAVYHEEMKGMHFVIDGLQNLNADTDRRLLVEILYNLLENTIMFRAENASNVRITGEVVDGKIKFTIIDNGIGMDGTVQEKIFDMFVKGTEKSQGLGLGLYIVKNALSILKGSIVLVKTRFGETEFQFELPDGGLLEDKFQRVGSSSNA
jgi:ligand-binding sensor domain-containing protein/signal transduction histidine kinase